MGLALSWRVPRVTAAGALLWWCIGTAVAAGQAVQPAIAACPANEPNCTAMDQAARAAGDAYQTIAAPTTSYAEGGENGAGQVTLNGTAIDGNKLLPGADKAKADQLRTLDSQSHSLDALHAAADAQTQADKTDSSVGGQAWNSFQRGAKAAVDGSKSLRQDNAFWTTSLNALSQAQAGNAAGEPVGTCTTTNTPTPVPSTGVIVTEKVCDIVQSPNSAPVCTRAFQWRTGAGAGEQPQSTTASLVVDQQANGLICGRAVTATAGSGTSPGSQTATLAYPNETAVAMCTRTRVATQHASWVDAQVTATVTVDTQKGGPVCTRQRWVTQATTTQPASKDATLNVDASTSGAMCTRTRTPEAHTSSVTQTQSAKLLINTTPSTTIKGSDWQWPTESTTLTPGSVAADLGVAGGHQGLVCSRTVWPTATPTHVPGTLQTSLGVDTETPHSLCTRTVTPLQHTVITPGSQTATLTVDTTDPGQVCARQDWPTPSTVSTPGRLSATLTPAPQGSTGVLQTLLRWPTARTGAPDPVPVAAQTQSGDTGFTFVGGTSSGSLLHDLHALVPPGATAVTGLSVQPNCSVAEVNPLGQTKYAGTPCASLGLVVTVAQAPTAANGWVARYSWSVGAGAKAATSYAVALHAAWTVGAYAGLPPGSATVRPSGGVGGRGGSSDTATLNLGPFVSADTLAIANLHVSAFCVGQRLQPCGMSLDAAGQPIGAPQVFTVTVTQAPSLANGWVATVRYLASGPCVMCGGPTAMHFVARWQVSKARSVTWTVKDTQGPAQPGTTPTCTTAYRCTGSAPTTINGVSVTAAMLDGLAPLYPSAPAACVAASNTQTCQGTGVTTATIDLQGSLPAGTTALTGLAFTVTNPQPGMAVALKDAPTAANHWVATFSITRTRWTEPGADPRIVLTWTAQQPKVSWSVKTTGSCDATGAPHCPLRWSCTDTAPSEVNGLSVTRAMAATLPPLFAGAPPACLAGTLNEDCSGGSAKTTRVSIAGQVPSGTTALTAFTFRVANPQGGVTVSLADAPTLANHWTATFTVTRTGWTKVPVSPQITMTWKATAVVTQVVVKSAGNCGDPGSASCPAKWSCGTRAPATVNDVQVTQAMAKEVAPLYPGAPLICAVGRLDAQCSGTASTLTTVDLSTHLPPDTSAIQGFRFTVTNPQSGITVSLRDAPTLANHWVATFVVTRTSWTAVPARPNIAVHWTATVPSISASVKTTGHCDAVSSSCSTRWACTDQAPTTVNGLPVSRALADRFHPLFPGAGRYCVTGEQTATCSGSGSVTHKVSIGSLLPTGTTAVQAFTFTVTNPQPDVVVTLADAPTASNVWTATFTITRANWDGSPVVPHVTLAWKAVVPTVSFAIKSSGNTSATGSAACPVAWSCVQSAPAIVNGVAVTPDQLTNQPVLYPGAATSCLKANLVQTCTGDLVKLTSVSIAAKLPAGSTSISDFAFKVTNPQSGVSVRLKTAPTLANGWEAVFRVDRDASVTAPAPPNIEMSWKLVTTTYTFQTVDSGDCKAKGTRSCPVAWSCTTTPPATINNIPVTAAMVAGQPPLFPGDTATCLVGSLDKTCTGTKTTTTTVSIADQIPAGTTAIQGVGFTVINPQSGVDVAMAGKPTAANGWVATFRVAQSDLSTPAVAPHVRITWSTTTTQNTFSVVDSGNCGSTGTPACPVSWSCSATAPATINGVAVTPAMLSGLDPLYPQGATSCVTAALTATCGSSPAPAPLHTMAARADAMAHTLDSPGQAVTTSTVDVSAKIPTGATTIRNVSLTVNNPQPGVAVALTTAPSLANHWVATVTVTRTDFSYVPVAPSITIAFQVPQASLSFTVADTGDCSAAGSAHCPVSWACTSSAPTTLNGIPVSAADVSGLAPLFPNASAVCVAGALSQACAGSASVNADVSIAAAMPPDATAVSDFRFSVTNRQTGVAVKLVAAPSLANHWVATFQVVRNYTTSGSTIDAPVIRMTWQAQAGTVVLGTSDSGNCTAATATASCAVGWTCSASAPATINGINVTADMLAAAHIRLFPSDTAGTCVTASENYTCSGPGTKTTQVSIASQLPAGTTAIDRFTWSVTTPVAGVDESLVSAPSAANNWVATFATTRTDWSQAPSAQPVVTLSWSVPGGNGKGLVAVDSGDCSAKGDAFCSTQWMCTAYASTAPTGGGTSEQDVPGSAKETLRGTPTGASVSVSIASAIPQGTTNLTNVAWVQVPGGGGDPCGDGPGQQPCAVVHPMAAGEASATLVTLPSLANNWTATFTVTSTCTDGLCTPAVGTLHWVAVIPGSAGGSSGGTGITVGDLQGVPPIYPGAPANCIAAQLVYSCSTINNGTVCHTDDQGRQVCDTVSGGTFDGCAAERNDPTCTLARTVCTDGATNADGFCYIQNQVYECRTPVTGPGTGITTTTQCNMNLPVCTTAGCTQQYSDTTTGSAVSASHAAANLAILEDINSDYVDGNVGAGSGGTGGTGGTGGPIGGGTGGGSQTQVRAPAHTAAATQAWTPWTTPGGTPATPPVSGSISPPPGWNPAAMTFFDGAEKSCMKVLGGMLNCCSKEAPVDGNKLWWQTYEKQLRSGWAGVASCSVAPGGTAPPNSSGSWQQANGNASMGSLSSSFTSSLENLTGNGLIPACATTATTSMQGVQQSFEQQADQQVVPKLAWYCNHAEKMLAVRKRLGECEYLGDYCKTKVLGSCLDKRQRYCCFNSPMTLLLREQLNKQGILGFGTAKDPQCGGATIAQMQQLNVGGMDTSGLEGNMIEAGAVPDVTQLAGSSFSQTFTGSGSAIGNAGRQDVKARTEGRMAGVDTTAAVDAILQQTERFVPNPGSVQAPTPTPGNITIANATVYVQRGRSFQVQVSRNGGAGAVSVQVSAVDGSAVRNIDYAFATSPQTLTWSNGDTSTKTITVYTFAPVPAVTVPRSFTVQLSNPGGGSVIYPTAIEQVTINPVP